MLAARVMPLPRAMGVSGLCQLVTLPLVYAPSQLGVAPTFVLAALQGLAAGAAIPLYHGFNYSNKWGGDTGTATVRMAVVEPTRLALLLVFVGVTVGLDGSDGGGDAGGGGASGGALPPARVQVFFGGHAALVLLLALLAFHIPIDPKLRLPRVPLDLHLFRAYRDATRSKWPPW